MLLHCLVWSLLALYGFTIHYYWLVDVTWYSRDECIAMLPVITVSCVSCVSVWIGALVTNQRVNTLRGLTYMSWMSETVYLDCSRYCLSILSKEALPKKKKICAGHRSSVTRLLNYIDSASCVPPTDSDKLPQFKLSHHEKLEMLK